MTTPPYGKAKDYAPGEERYQSAPKRTMYRHGYTMGRAGSLPEHNPHSGKSTRAIWEAGRARGAEDAARDAAGTNSHD